MNGNEAPQMKVYISGKITGMDLNEAEAMFLEAEVKLRKLGFIPVNPLNNNIPIWSTWREHMRKDIQMLMSCDAIYSLPNWEESKGAILERHIAEQLGFTVIGKLK